MKQSFNDEDTSRIIEMAWEDRTPFEAIATQFGMIESDVIRFMRYHLKSGSFKLWRKRVSGRVTKHAMRRPDGIDRGYCSTQYKHRGK
ncbi:TIGR03643 family protein [Enterovibrio calviensis]|uniref:TIGR03643 family protein n=1 Tax=Enterovibrio calviensis TaxID=91359 RepID=UPI0004856B6E|nr:TIGR03643 family protein [Enterovibrio calviensis]